MFVQERPSRYGAYLLRYWEVRSDRPDRPSTWPLSLEEAGTGERHGFHDLEDLVAFLERELGREAAGAASAQEDEKDWTSSEDQADVSRKGKGASIRKLSILFPTMVAEKLSHRETKEEKHAKTRCA